MLLNSFHSLVISFMLLYVAVFPVFDLLIYSLIGRNNLFQLNTILTTFSFGLKWRWILLILIPNFLLQFLRNYFNLRLVIFQSFGIFFLWTLSLFLKFLAIKTELINLILIWIFWLNGKSRRWKFFVLMIKFVKLNHLLFVFDVKFENKFFNILKLIMKVNFLLF